MLTKKMITSKTGKECQLEEQKAEKISESAKFSQLLVLEIRLYQEQVLPQTLLTNKLMAA
jgi:hypothetical protein